MNIAYIITVYHKPNQIVRLIRNLNHEAAHFFVHLDKTKDIRNFKSAFNEIAGFAKVHFLKREDSRWGRWGFTQAMINGLLAIKACPVQFDYVFTLSGQDFPIKPNDYIFSFVEENSGKIFLEHFSMPCIDWNYGGMDRLEHYHFDFLGDEYAYPSKKKLKSFREIFMQQIFKRYFPLPRVYPKKINFFGGSCWFGMPIQTVEYILDYLSQNPDYLRFHKFTYLPDEIFFQTILLNSGRAEIIENIKNQNVTFLEWEGESFVRVFGMEDFSKLASSEKLFARKFDDEAETGFLDFIEEQLLKKIGHSDGGV